MVEDVALGVCEGYTCGRSELAKLGRSPIIIGA